VDHEVRWPRDSLPSCPSWFRSCVSW